MTFPSELDPLTGLPPVDPNASDRASLEHPDPGLGSVFVGDTVVELAGPLRRRRGMPQGIREAAVRARAAAPRPTRLDPSSGLPELDRGAVVEGRWFDRLKRQTAGTKKRRRGRRSRRA